MSTLKSGGAFSSSSFLIWTSCSCSCSARSLVILCSPHCCSVSPRDRKRDSNRSWAGWDLVGDCPAVPSTENLERNRQQGYSSKQSQHDPSTSFDQSTITCTVSWGCQYPSSFFILLFVFRKWGFKKLVAQLALFESGSCLILAAFFCLRIFCTMIREGGGA